MKTIYYIFECIIGAMCVLILSSIVVIAVQMLCIVGLHWWLSVQTASDVAHFLLLGVIVWLNFNDPMYRSNNDLPVR